MRLDTGDKMAEYRAMICFAKFLASRLRSFGFAWAGLGYALKSQGNIRVHLGATLLVLAFGAALGVSRLEWGALIGAVGLVWMAELLNSALETLCDHVAPAQSEAIKHSKDLAAAAVLMAALAAAVIGGLVFAPYVFA